MLGFDFILHHSTFREGQEGASVRARRESPGLLRFRRLPRRPRRARPAALCRATDGGSSDRRPFIEASLKQNLPVAHKRSLFRLV